MTGLELRDVEVRFGDLRAVDGVSLELPPGHILALLGASGSGKSTLLRAVAGLQPTTRGSISWNGEDLAHVKIHKRGFGMVFQDGQLFPNLDVGRNVAYGIAHLPPPQRAQRVAEMLSLVDLAGYERRQTTQLSGGQAQRVALARSLAPAPRLLLLDEPLSALEEGLRRHLAVELSRILREVGSTAVYVTHDQEEASTIGDTVAVMSQGRILQRDHPDRLWSRPESMAVAAFLGSVAFLPLPEARALGWTGTLPDGHVLGVGDRSFTLADDGVEVPVLDEGYARDRVEIGIRLPSGQRVVVRSDRRADGPTVRVRLATGVAVPSHEGGRGAR